MRNKSIPQDRLVMPENAGNLASTGTGIERLIERDHHL